MLKEFKEFALRGNVMDLAIGIIIGGAFGKIVSSFVADVIMPLIGLLLGKINFANLFVNLGPEKYTTLVAAQEAGASTLNYGLFINAIVDFLIVAFVIFLVVKGINKMQKPAPVAAPTTKKCPFCFTDIALEAKRCPNCTSQLD